MSPDAGARYRRAVREGWWSREHGAWAVLLLPFLAGMLRAGPEPVHVPLLIAWLTGYLGLGAGTTWGGEVARRRRREETGRGPRRPDPPAAPRGRSAALTYGAIAVVALAAVLLARPDLLVWGALYLPVAALTWWFTRTGRARTIVADAVVMVGAAAFTLVTYQAGNPPGGTIGVGRFAVGALSVVVLAYLFGCALHVKALVRERGSLPHALASAGFHAACTAALVVLAALPHRQPGLTHRTVLACAALFALLTARTVAFTSLAAALSRPARPGASARAQRRISPAVVGAAELLPALALLFIARHWG